MRILLYYRKEDYSRDCLNIFQSNFLKSSLHSYFDVLGFDGIVSPKDATMRHHRVFTDRVI